MPLSSELAQAVVELIEEAWQGRYPEREVQALVPLFEVQSRCSRISGRDELLIETIKTRAGASGKSRGWRA